MNGVMLGSPTSGGAVSTRTAGPMWVWRYPDCIEWCEGGGARGGRVDGWARLPLRAGQRLVVCLPGALVRIHHVRTPMRNRRRFMAALPYVLEDRLAEDVDRCHLVPVARRRRELAIAVVARGVLDEVLDGAGAVGHRPTLVLADYLALPEPAESTWVLDMTAHPALLRHTMGGAALGAVGRILPPALVLALESASPSPQRLVVAVGNESQAIEVASWRERLETQGVELEIVIETAPRARRLADHRLPREQLNLLSGNYRDPMQGNAGARRLMPAVGLAAAVMLCGALGFVLETRALGRQHAAFRAALENTYRQAFPDTRNVVDARFQMERRLEQIGAAVASSNMSVPGDLVGWLEALAPVLIAADGVRVEALHYDDQGLIIEVVAATPAALDALGRDLTRLARVRWHDGDSPADPLRGRFHITRPA
jgi:general secretion pathway protein L